MIYFITAILFLGLGVLLGDKLRRVPTTNHTLEEFVKEIDKLTESYMLAQRKKGREFTDVIKESLIGQAEVFCRSAVATEAALGVDLTEFIQTVLGEYLNEYRTQAGFLMKNPPSDGGTTTH